MTTTALEGFMKSIWFRRVSTLLLAVYWFAMFLGTHLPRAKPPIPGASDKTHHYLAYFGLSLLVSGWLAVRRRVGVRELIGVLCLLALYGGFDEITQPLVQRTCDLRDWFADVSGVTTGLLFFFVGKRLWRRTAITETLPLGLSER